MRRHSVLLTAVVVALCSAGAAAPALAADRSLEHALRELERRGLKLVYSSNVVRPEMRVVAEPTASEPRAALDQLLAPHALVAIDGPKGTLVIVPTPADEGAPGGTANPQPDDPETDARASTPVILDELVVTPSRMSLLRREPMASVGLSRDEILALPHLGEDFFRALNLLPGTQANDVSAQFHVRGGRRDETQILIDGQELFDAFHLKERDNAVSLVATTTLNSADLTTGGFSAEYGDRMSGVLDMTTLTPRGKPRYRAGVGFLNANLGGGGRLAADRGSWLVELRRGATDLIGRLLGDEDPEYWDGFSKVEIQLGESASLRGNALAAADELDFEQTVDEDRKRFRTAYDSAYLWLTHQVLFGDRLVVDTALATTSIQRDRRALEQEEDAAFEISDRRDLDVRALRQDWRLRLGAKRRLTWGLRLRDFDTTYDYSAARDLANPLALIRHDSPRGANEFRARLEERQVGAYYTDRIEIDERWTAELGLRLDRHSQTDESHLTPRLNLAWAPVERTVLRLAWGRYYQSQRPYELQVEDGDNVFQPVERSEHRVLGLERLLPGAGRRRATTVRLELYQRLVGNPRRRYENLYEPINSFPEAEPDRVRVDAERVRAEGLEVFVRGAWTDRLAWWVNYTLSRADDRVAGRWQPRLFDQTHALNLDLDYRINRRWRLNVAWRFHTGWPTTPLAVGTAVDDDGEPAFVPVLGPINSQRLSDYHRLDLRASRGWSIGASDLTFYLDVQNAYSRRNAAGFDLFIDPDDGGLERDRETWPGFLPSAGVTIEF